MARPSYLGERVFSISCFFAALLFFGSIWYVSVFPNLSLNTKILITCLGLIPHGVLFCFEPYVRGLDLFRSEWGRLAQGGLALFILFASSIPMCFLGLNDKSMCCMPGILLWAFSIEKLIDSTTDLQILGLVSSLTIATASPVMAGHYRLELKVVAWMLSLLPTTYLTLLKFWWLPINHKNPILILPAKKSDRNQRKFTLPSNKLETGEHSMVLQRVSEYLVHNAEATDIIKNEWVQLINEDGICDGHVYRISLSGEKQSTYRAVRRFRVVKYLGRR